MAADSIANASDSELLTILDQVRTTMAGALADYPNITAGMVSDLDTLRDAFQDRITAHVDAQATARSERVAKDAKRSEVEAAIREVRNIAKASGATEASMTALGIPKGGVPAPTTATVPLARVDTSERLKHTINFTDAAEPDNKRRPRGAVGAEIWVKLDGSPPADESECQFLAIDTATPYVAEYTGADAGKMAHYLLRWRLRDESTTAFGETVSATITG